MELMFLGDPWSIVLYLYPAPPFSFSPDAAPRDTDVVANPSRIFERIVNEISQHYSQEHTISTHAQFGKFPESEFYRSLVCQWSQSLHDLKGHFAHINLLRGEYWLLGIGSCKYQ